MNFQVIADLIKKDAPLLAQIISSANPAAGVFVNLVLSLFGVKSAEELPVAIQNDPEAAIKIKDLELTHKNDLSKIISEDRMSARDREKFIVEATGKRDLVLDLIALGFIVFFFGLLFVNCFMDVKNDHLLTMMIGQLSAGVGLILAYYFGSSNN